MGLLETKYTIFSKIQQFETNEKLSFGNALIGRVTNLKHLAIITQKDHLKALSIKTSRGTSTLGILNYFIPLEALKNLYYTLVSSCLG